MKTNIRKIAIAAMFAALVCVATMVIHIPSPLQGYINLGDCMVLLSGWLLSPFYGFLAAGAGSALADIFSGYVIYAPVTFVIKGLMALAAFYIFKVLEKKLSNFLSRIITAVLAEIIMIAGYLVFESFMYGFTASLVNLLPNAVQGAVGIIIGVILIKIFERYKIIDIINPQNKK